MINFIFREMTSLKYFMPIVIEANKRGVESTFYVDFCQKYNCPSRYTDYLEELMKRYNISSRPISEASRAVGHTIYCEDSGLGCQDGSFKYKKISLTYQNDFFNEVENTNRYHKYHLKYFDHIVFPSKFFAEFHKCVSDKNLYLGCPKYDIKISKNNVLEKYNLPENKNALLIFPKPRDLDKIDLNKIVGFLYSLGYNVLIKNREKDRLTGLEQIEYYFEDASWFPPTTLELLSVSDFAINFGSTTVKECVMSKTPLINFPIKPHEKIKTLPFFYEYGYCKELLPDVDFNTFKLAQEEITSSDHSKEFKKSISNHMMNVNSSKLIVDFIESEDDDYHE
jgi:hypothetical protein